MKLIIDIPDVMYDWFDTGFPTIDDAKKLWQIVKNGKIIEKHDGKCGIEMDVEEKMTDEWGEVFGLEKQELAEFNAVIIGMLIPKLIQIADKHNIDRNSMIKFTADTLTAMSEIATFENFEV